MSANGARIARNIWLSVNKESSDRVADRLWCAVIRKSAEAVLESDRTESPHLGDHEDIEDEVEKLIIEWQEDSFPEDGPLAVVLGGNNYNLFLEGGFGWKERMNLAGYSVPWDMDDLLSSLKTHVDHDPGYVDLITETNVTSLVDT